jgi:biotin operon repressor
MVSEKLNYLGILERDLGNQIFSYLKREYGFPNAICRSLRDDFLRFMHEYLGDEDFGDGVLYYSAIKSDVPVGTKVKDMDYVRIKLHLWMREDIESAMVSQDELLKNRIVRLTNEAFDQGALLTQADLSILLGESIKTISRKINELKQEGIIVPTRGNRMDIGPGVSHKSKIVEMYLRGYEFTDIKRNTRHSSESILRYLREFVRIVHLYLDGYSYNEIRRITSRSIRLIREYVSLYEVLSKDEDCDLRIRDLFQKYGIGEKNGYKDIEERR